jgi:hypothetical protein
VTVLSPRSRALTRDVVWSLGAAIITVALMGFVNGSFALVSLTSQQSVDDSNLSQNATYAASGPQFDSSGELTDQLPVRADQSPAALTDNPVDTGTGETATDSTAAVSGSLSETPDTSRSSQPAASTTTPSSPSSSTPTPDTDAVRTPTPTSPTPSTEPTRQQQIETIADRLPFNWRAAGVTLKAECAPNRSHCRWGLYVVSSNTIWVGTDAFANSSRLFYVVAHELAHAWQFSNDPHARMNDLVDWGHTGVDGLEAAADCLSQAWGATTNHYWNCPADAQRHMVTVFNGT